MKTTIGLTWIVLIILAAGCDNKSKMEDKTLAFIGTYTQKEGHVDGKGAGVLIYETGPLAENWKLLSTFSNIVNPSYLCLSPTLPVIYAVSEQGPGVPAPGSVIKVIKYDAFNFQMEELQSIGAKGDAPCYISTSRDGKYVFAANYVTGNIVQYAIKTDGTLEEGIAFQPLGSGPHSRQEGPHAHYIKQHPTGNEIYGVDLGTDMITKYRSDKNGFHPLDTIQMEAGSGPRHLVWDKGGKSVYVLNELSGTVEQWTWTNDNAVRRSVTSLVQQGDSLQAGSADIHISTDGRFIYASLRGDYNEVVVLEVNAETGGLNIIQRVGAGGIGPRNFSISPDGDYLVVALQDSDKINLFDRNQENGTLSQDFETIDVSTPVCIVFN